MSIKTFLRNYLLEQDENVVHISPEQYIETLENVGGIADRVSKLKPYRGKGIVIDGNLDLRNFKTVGQLTGIIKVSGRLDISNTNVSNVNGITVDGYVSDYGSSMWRIKMQAELNKKLADLDEKRQEGEWNVENKDDDSERTEALYKYLKQNGDVDMVEDEEGNEVPEDKYYIYPNGRANYGFGKQYEWLGGGNGFNPNTFDVYTEDEADDAAKQSVESMLEDMGIDAFREWVLNDSLNQNSWKTWLHEFYDEYVRDNPDDFNIPLELSSRQSWEKVRLQSLVDSLNDKLERNRIEKKSQEEYDQIKEKIKSLEETIQEIIDDPQGDYDESAIENEINDSVSEWEDDIRGFIKNYGYDNNFIMDFVDTEKVVETVVNSDGIGSILSSYDGDYDTFNINGTEYYVMRVS